MRSRMEKQKSFRFLNLRNFETDFLNNTADLSQRFSAVNKYTGEKNNEKNNNVPSEPANTEPVNTEPANTGAGETNEDKTKVINELGTGDVPDIQSDIHVISVIGEIEGHQNINSASKTTKYEHIIPQLVAVEESRQINGLLIVLNTVGGDVEAGLAISEMIASMKKPTVSLVLGGGHSIGVPIAVASKKSFIAPTATMTIHPIRLTGMVIGVPQSFDYIEKMQDRVISFITEHSDITAERFKKYMMNTGELTRDIGTIVVGQSAVESGLIDEVGGLKEALAELHSMIEEYKKNNKKQ